MEHAALMELLGLDPASLAMEEDLHRLARSFHKEDRKKAVLAAPERYSGATSRTTSGTETFSLSRSMTDSDQYYTELVPQGGTTPLGSSLEDRLRYLKLWLRRKLVGEVELQAAAFAEGLRNVVSLNVLAMFSPQELQQMLSGGELDDDAVDEWKANTRVRGTASEQQKAEQLEWLFQIIRSQSPNERATILEYCSGSRRRPLRGFATKQMSLNISPDQHPCAHTCSFEMDLPVFESMEQMQQILNVLLLDPSFTRM